MTQKQPDPPAPATPDLTPKGVEKALFPLIRMMNGYGSLRDTEVVAILETTRALAARATSPRDTTHTGLLAEVARLRPHYQSQTATDIARRQMLDHFEKFALLDTPPAPQETAGEAVADDTLHADLAMAAEMWALHSVGEKSPTFSRGDARHYADLFQRALRATTHPTPTAAPTDNAALVEAWKIGRTSTLNCIRHGWVEDRDEKEIEDAILAMSPPAALDVLASRPAEATSRERVEGMPSGFGLRGGHENKPAVVWDYHDECWWRQEYIRADHTTPPEDVGALVAAERFISGFEGDETQVGVADLLATIRAAIASHKGGA
ncbi:hypothetical protein [Falsirhodobacter halotolerans]|uniref:hypothetical protein n=1 Tax=Falsirhodobacter halotolerans TaxID=1146892 RepID=UPI001FD2AA4B|nr:hypothetical protein [Falsirhodobacter halotolerans]MCJ8138632.1 hypothetical protein [Falsirhodobacter halotolerans]